MLNTWRAGGGRAAAIVAAALALAAAGLVRPQVAAAQEERPGEAWEREMPAPANLELTGFIAAIFPMSMLGSQGDTLQAELSTKPAFAAELDLWLGGGFGIGFMGGFAAPNLSLTRADIDTGQQTVEELGVADYVHGEAVLKWRPELTGSAAVLLPYFGAGAGVRRLDFENDSGFEDTTDVVLVLDMGAHVRISDAVHLRLDLRDLVSRFEGGPFQGTDTQHDVFAQVGVGIGF